MEFEVGDEVDVDQGDGTFHRATVVGFEMVRCPLVRYRWTESQRYLSITIGLNLGEEPDFPDVVLPRELTHAENL